MGPARSRPKFYLPPLPNGPNLEKTKNILLEIFSLAWKFQSQLTISISFFLSFCTLSSSLSLSLYPLLLIYICTYIYIHAGELLGCPRFGLQRVIRLAPLKVIRLSTFLGGHFRTIKIGFFWGFLGSFLVPNSVFGVSCFLLISHLFFWFSSFF